MPSIATRSRAFAGEFRSALNVVSPAHSSGAASAHQMPLRELTTILLAFAIITSAYPPS